MVSYKLIYIIIGIYLLIVKPILSILLNKVYSIGFDVPIDPLSYWGLWLATYGWITILSAVCGAQLINIGYKKVKKTLDIQTSPSSINKKSTNMISY